MLSFADKKYPLLIGCEEQNISPLISLEGNGGLEGHRTVYIYCMHIKKEAAIEVAGFEYRTDCFLAGFAICNEQNCRNESCNLWHFRTSTKKGTHNSLDPELKLK